MSSTIKQAIQALKSRIADAYTAIVAKGGTLPAQQTAANLPTAISSIPAGIVEPEPKDVDVIDYDGTLLASYTYAEFAALQSLPTPPTHDGLIFAEWVPSLADAQADPINYGVIGALYSTNDSKNHLFIRISNANESFSINGVSSGETIDWGDGTTTTATGTDTHIYTQAGDYEIKTTGLLSLTIPNDGSKGKLLKAYIHNGVVVNVGYCGNLQALCFNSSTGLGPYNDEAVYCGQLRAIVSKRDIGMHRTLNYSGIRYLIGEATNANAVTEGCSALRKISFIPGGTAFVKAYSAFRYCSALNRIIIPSFITEIPQYWFVQCTNLRNLYLYCTSVPTLSSTNTFDNTNPECVIHVKNGLLSSYQSATNWATITAQFTFVEDL